MQIGPTRIPNLMGVNIATLVWNDETYRRPPPFDRANNLVLRITQKYNFIQVNPGSDGNVTDYDGHHFPAQAWLGGEFETVCNGFIRVAHQFWNNRFWLRIPDNCQLYDYAARPHYPVVRPSVQCLFEAQRSNHSADDVINVQVANPSGVSTETNAAGAHFSFRADNRHWIPSNATLGRNISGNSQIALVHEVGHNLGEDHVAGLGGSVEDYGGVNPHPDEGTYHRSRSIMGGGMEFEGWNAYAWQIAMQRFTQIPFDQWEGSTRELFPDIPEPRHASIPSADMVFTEEELYAGTRRVILTEPIVISGRVRQRGRPHRDHRRR